jgi:hypothetical protein
MFFFYKMRIAFCSLNESEGWGGDKGYSKIDLIIIAVLAFNKVLTDTNEKRLQREARCFKPHRT